MRGGVEKMELNQSQNGTNSRFVSEGATDARENVLDHNLYSRQMLVLVVLLSKLMIAFRLK